MLRKRSSTRRWPVGSFRWAVQKHPNAVTSLHLWLTAKPNSPLVPETSYMAIESYWYLLYIMIATTPFRSEISYVSAPQGVRGETDHSVMIVGEGHPPTPLGTKCTFLISRASATGASQVDTTSPRVLKIDATDPSGLRRISEDFWLPNEGEYARVP
jgi:hypothetical protein